MRLHSILLITGLFTALAGLRGDEVAKQPPVRTEITSHPRLPASLHEALQNADFPEAVRLIDAALAEPKVTSPDYLIYLKGRALTEAGELDKAWATFTDLEKTHPQSPWVSRSRFGRAAVLVKQRNYPNAGMIYKAEAERLLSNGRKDELTAIYLEFADRYYEGIPVQGPTSEKKPDYAQALAFYQQALGLQPSLAVRQKIELRIARCHQELNQLNEAIAAYQKFFKNYAHKTTRPADRVAPALDAEAQYQLGRAQLAAGQAAEARKTWQDFLTSSAAKEAGESLVAEASYRLAHTYGMPAPPTVGDLELGVAALEKFVKAFPKHLLASQAEFEIAQSYTHHGRLEPAVTTLKAIIANPNYLKAPQVPAAWNLLGQLYAGQKKYTEAIATWREFLDKFPTDPNWSAVQRLIIDTEYAMAVEQKEQENYAAARKLWETFLNKYPLDSRAALILLEFGQMKYEEGVKIAKPQATDKADSGTKVDANAPLAVSRELFQSAIEDWTRLVTKYPGTDESSRAAYSIGLTLEDNLGKLSEALGAYKKVEGKHQPLAQRRIAQLTAKQLELITERKFRSNEKPRIKVTTRNIENVSVKLYRIDMTDYFRKMHLAGGVESLDIALIDPDETWDQKTDNYEKYRRVEQSIEIPVEGPGVTAVTVTSDTLEATTMVVVSDIDIIVKSSRNELFVFAEDMLKGQPAEGVSLLVSDGNKVFAEVATGKEGILQKKFDELKTVNDLRVFAVRDGHSASSLVNLEGLQFSVGLSPKGYLYADRPAYRAGQLVHLKGLIRWVADDRYTFKAGEKYQLNVYDARSRVIHHANIALNEFGAFAEHFTLPPSAPQGQYRVHLFQPGREPSYESSFQVHEYQLEPIHFTVELPRKVFYRGEQVTGKFVLKYYYGTPLIGKTIQYRLGDDRIYTAETDARGEVAFDLPTQRYSESQPLALVAQFGERNLATGETIHLATRGFQIGVSTLRNVYVAGETFDAVVAVTDPAGKPLGAALKLDVLEQTPAARGLPAGERLVQTHEIKADEKTGETRQTLRVEKAGRYIVRAQGTDRFGNPVSGTATLLISGDEDRVRLRILSDKHHYKVGDTGRVQLHWREKPALALITYEGAEVLGYLLTELKTGANALDIPLVEKLAPNFRLSVAVMQQDKYHEAHSDFRVTRELRIVLKPNQTTLKPGDPLTVEITTTDPQGKPVSAELTLALIQKNLLQMFPEQLPAITEFFNGGNRDVSVRAMASCTFRYAPHTRPINEFLLAEADRQKIREQEATARIMLSERQSLARKEKQLSALTVRTEEESLEVEARLQLGQDLELRDQQSDEKAGVSAMDRPVSGSVAAGFGAFGRPNTAGGAGGAMAAGSAGRMLSRAKKSAAGVRAEDARRAGATASGESFGRMLREVDFDALTVAGDHNDTFYAYAANASGKGDVSNFSRRGLQLLSDADGTVIALNGRGELQVVNGLPLATLEQMAKEGLQIVAGRSSAETGYWNPRVVTDKDGKATLLLKLPDRSTAWKLLSKGISGDALAGQVDAEIVTKKDLFGEMKVPLAFTVGDKAEVLVEVHNTTPKDATIEVKLKTTIGEKTTELKKSVAVKQTGIEEVSFPVEITSGETAEFELAVASGELRDVSSRSVTIKPYGLPVFATASGSSSQNTTAYINHPVGVVAENPALELIIGPSVNRALLDAVLSSTAGLYERSFHQPRSDLERAISDVLGGVGLMKMVGQSRTSNTPEAQALAGKIQAGISLITSSQRDDGGWSWSGQPKTEKSDRYLTSRTVWALSAARKAGFAVGQESFDKGVQHLQSAFAVSGESENEAKAIILHGLAEAGVADFAHANRLHRSRNTLSASGLLHVSLALLRLDRKSMAQELLELAKAKIPVTGAARIGSDDAALKGCIPWMQSGVELRALYLLALNEVESGGTRAGELADWLMATRVGTRWIPEKANGPAIAALADWFGRAKLTPEKYTLTIYANDKQVTKITVDPSTEPSRTVPVPAQMLVAGKPQKINIDIEGRGMFSYSAVLSGFIPAEKLKGTATDWHFTRYYQPAPRLLDGEEIPRGFGILTGGYSAFRNLLTQLPLGEKGEVTIHVWRDRVTGEKDEQLDYLIYTEPIPAGTSVLIESIQGQFERYEIAPGSITFYIGDRPHTGTIQFSLVGYLPGQYKNVPSFVRSFYQPEKIAVAKGLPLDVLARGAKSKDEYKLTPQELYEFGKRLLTKRDFKPAGEHLSQLFKTYRLQDQQYREVVQMLFEVALVTNEPADIIQFFEIIKEKYSDVEVSFENILKVGQAYTQLGEYERSYLVYRATAEASFLRESQIAGFLDERGEFLRSVQVMERLLNEYPSEAYIATATYALAQEIYGKAPEAAQNPKLREANVTRVDLIGAAIHLLDHFLSTWPTDPAADQASFALVNAQLDIEQYAAAIERAQKSAERYPDSKLLDSFWYVIGYSQFALGKHEAALDMVRKVADLKRKDPQTGVELAAANHWQAIYIMGQVYHSLGRPAEAISEYQRVKDRFSDAAEAIDFFTHRALNLPEVTTVKPGAVAKVPLKYRNVAAANVKVYRIDLLKFGLLQRNLSRITAINLAGIRPYHHLALNLGDGKDYRDREKELELPLKDEGAYLVVCQGENFYTSGLVLVTPLVLEVQEDAASGRVRVTVQDAVAEKYAHDVHVKVIGSANDQFVSGQTDLRGIFVADGIVGTSTVIARTGTNRYAFHRGKTPLGNVPTPQLQATQPAVPPSGEKKPADGKDKLLENLRGSNEVLQQEQRLNYRNLLNNTKQGVEAKTAY